MKKTIFFLCIAFVLLMLLLPTGEVKEMRLRVIANSDDPSDQTVKMEVVNAVDRMLDREHFKSLDTAEAWIEENTDKIKTVCADTLGSDRFTLELRDEEYSDGVYRSLVITLGEGEGHNFWGTLFPNVSERISAARGDGKSFGVVSKNGRLAELRLWIVDLLS